MTVQETYQEHHDFPALGLRRGVVAHRPYATEWAAAFAMAARRIRERICPDWPVEHIGSTAVPGLIAKPILDIGILVPNAEALPRAGAALTALGYRYRGDAGSSGGHVYVAERSAGERVQNLHVLVSGDPAWGRYIRFRDALREDVALRDAYAALKRRLADVHPNDRRAYTRAKGDFILKTVVVKS